MKKILPICLLLAACQTDQPTVESVNAAAAAREGRCEQQGYKRGSKDFQTCVQLAMNRDAAAPTQDMLATQTALGGALVGLSLLSAFSDERLKRDIVPVGEENGFHIYRFRYVWSDEEYIGVMAQEVQRIRPDAVVVDSEGLLRVNYHKIGVALRRLN
jgi:hypothetical protein